MTEESDRRTRLLDETQRLIAEQGLGAVTHRRVENAAGAPHGSVTYWFTSRDGLVAALVDRLCDESERRVGQIAAAAEAQLSAGQLPDPETVASALIAWMDGAADLHRVRLELELQGAREPALGERMTRAARTFWAMGTAVCAAMGSADAPRDGRAIAAMLDGILLDRVSRDARDDAVVRAAVRWLLIGPPGP